MVIQTSSLKYFVNKYTKSFYFISLFFNIHRKSGHIQQRTLIPDKYNRLRNICLASVHHSYIQGN